MFGGYLDATLLGGIARAIDLWPHSQWILMAQFTALNAALAVAKHFGGKNGTVIVGLSWASVLLIPAEAAQHLSFFTMQVAHEVCRVVGMPEHQGTAYNLICCAMMYVPWQTLGNLQASDPHAETAPATNEIPGLHASTKAATGTKKKGATKKIR
mmetsp:Transcript_52254/g.93732  ORF Transcript_52254/g.93732 Transcript_52254/m.93732 type:complete len:155 (-) Transcript_52254:425-889(-)